jgi:hypothetical protein
MFKLLLVFFTFINFANASEEWSLDGQIDWYNRYIHRPTKESLYNPGNEFARIPQETIQSDLRPTLTLEKNEHYFKINPRVILDKTFTSRDHKDEETLKADLFLNEAFYQITLDQHQFVFGLQNYQWGPAEMLSPTNPMFRFLQDQRSFFFQQRGRNIVRWNWTLNQSLSIVSLIEVTKNDVDLPRADQEFSPNGLVKIEKSFDQASDYVGLVVGVTPAGENFIGEYGSFGFGDGQSLYFDLRHQEGTRNFYPVNSQNGFIREDQRYIDSKKVFTLATAGLRHEGRADFRLEYIYYGLGLDNQDWKQAQNSLTQLSPYLKENAERFYLSGRELQREHYLYSSVRIPDLGAGDIYTVFLRYFYSIQDSSSISQLLIDRATGDHFNLYLELSTYQGSRKAEFSSLIATETSIGFKWTY